MSDSRRFQPKAGRFQETDWALFDQLKSAAPDRQRSLLDIVARKYWAPIYGYLLRRGYNQTEAQDLTQDFFAFALQTQLFTKADSKRGRFRSFLLGSLNNFAANDRRKGSTRKRKPAGNVVSLEQLASVGYFTPTALTDETTPEIEFHNNWLREVVRNALDTLEKKSAAAGRLSYFQLFRSRVIAPELDGDDPPPLDQQAAELKLGYKEAANQVVTMKRAFLRILTKEIRIYAQSDEDASFERQDILRLLVWDNHR